TNNHSLSCVICLLCFPRMHPFNILLSADPPPTHIYTLSLHDALPICHCPVALDEFAESVSSSSAGSSAPSNRLTRWASAAFEARSEEHTSELQSRFDLVCRLLLEKKKERTHTQ